MGFQIRDSLMDRRKNKSHQTTVDGIHFKSKLEAYTYVTLKANGLDFQYEAHSFILLDADIYNGVSMELRGRTRTYEDCPEISKISYKPDFVSLKDGWIIECKGHPNERFPMVWKMFKTRMSKVVLPSGKTFDLYVPRTSEHVLKTINLIKQRKCE